VEEKQKQQSFILMSISNEIKSSFTKGDNLIRLIYINIAMFVVVNIPVLLAYLFAKKISFTPWLAVPAALPELVHKPWTIITYMFFHLDVWHILFNLIFLYWFGTIFLQHMNQRLLLNLYILGGISGALFYIAAYNLFPVFLSVYYVSDLLGASAAAMAVMIAAAMRAPDFKINLFLVWSVKIKYIAIFLIALDIFTISYDNPGGHISHLGGAFAGLLFILFQKKGTDITGWMDPFWDFSKSLFYSKPKMKVTYRRPQSDFEYNKQKADESKELDRILDKIKTGGYNGLTKEEKEFLFKQSKK
jgi:membrane associated rhomboid family serine protease